MLINTSSFIKRFHSQVSAPWGKFLKNIQKTNSTIEFTSTLSNQPTPMFNFEHEKQLTMVENDSEKILDVYQKMTQLRVMDQILNDAQRQGRISFYMTHLAEEGVVVGSAASLDPDDIVYGQYREAGVLLWRGMTVEQMLHQCYGTKLDLGKGRQMTVHYGSKELNFHTISSPLATQIPQAPGAAYTLKQDNKDNVVACYFGEGAASEGDFHAGINFASTLDLPVLFFCRNNGFAISTSAEEQYRGDGILAKAVGHGLEAVRVDGTDTLAVMEVTKQVRERILETGRPILIEAMAYRAGHHSTSDDSTAYRAQEEINHWLTEENDCNFQLRSLLIEANVWSEEQDAELNKSCKQTVLNAIKIAESTPKQDDSNVFNDVYG